jgi:multidrug transporter EmrE-like cation transporter
MGAWAILAFCIVAEVSATSLLTRSEGFGRPLYGLLALVILGGCFWALSQVLTRIPMGVAYAIWSGAGIALICVAGWFRLCCRSLKTPGDKFPARSRNKPRSLIDVASGSLPKSSVSLSPGDEVLPHMFTRKPRLQLEKFVINGAKRLLQHNLPTTDI